MIATISYSDHSEYCLSFWDNICRCGRESNNIQYISNSYDQTRSTNDIAFTVKSITDTYKVAEFKRSSLKFMIYYEAVGESRKLAKDIIPVSVPKKIVFAKQPEVMYHKLRCMKLRPRLSLLKRVMKRFK